MAELGNIIHAGTRCQLAALFHGAGAELGVAGGEFSACILSNGAVDRLYSIDRWRDHHDESEYRRACQLLSAFGQRSVVLRSTFAAAAPGFRDGELDFIYIDGYAHTGQEHGQTLADWWPKLRRGGIFAGHDYCERYRPTMDVVNEFVTRHNLPLWTTQEDELPSWATRKP